MVGLLNFILTQLNLWCILFIAYGKFLTSETKKNYLLFPYISTYNVIEFYISVYIIAGTKFVIIQL